MLCRREVQQKRSGNTAVAEAARLRAGSIETVDAVDYRAGRTTGPKRSAVKGQAHLADLVCSTKEGRGDCTRPH